MKKTKDIRPSDKKQLVDNAIRIYKLEIIIKKLIPLAENGSGGGCESEEIVNKAKRLIHYEK